ncbi:MAG: hypothetical protein KY463_13720 [Actinobacteria bacterium]|nr:hypothetical protein [Actinomycetota bacterium]
MSQPPVPPPLEYAPPPAKPAARVSRLAVLSLALGLLTGPVVGGVGLLLGQRFDLFGGEGGTAFAIAVVAGTA